MLLEMYGQGLFLDIQMTECLPDLKEKLCSNGDMETGTSLEHCKYLAIHLISFGIKVAGY